MDISLGRVLEAARERRATLTPEVAGYVVLLAARQLDVERSRVSAHSVLVDETGDVRVERDADASEVDIDAELRRLLGALIALCSSPPPAIVAVAERPATGDLRELSAELSAALIPINPAAAHRALARLYRETRRADDHMTASALPPISARDAQPSPAELDIDVVVEPEGAVSSLAEAVAAREEAPHDPIVSDEPLADEAPAEAPLPELPRAKPRWSDARSDVHELLAAFLADTRSVEHMLRVLRDMIGLEVRPRPDESVDAAHLVTVPR